MKKISICFILFLAFLAYRIHFWGDFVVHGQHALFNSLLDAGLSVSCGMLLFELNAKMYWFRKWIFFFSIVIITAFSFVLYGLHAWVYSFYTVLDPGFTPMFKSLCFQLLDSGAVVITGALVYLLHLFSHEKKNLLNDMQQLSAARDKAELNYLKSRIDPHFIFNGLNSIYHEIGAAGGNAKTSLLQFSDIMRYHLQYASNEKVNFFIELQYLRSYINFQYKRTSDFLEIEQDYSVEDSETQIEPLLILPFVENAFKFCSAAAQKKGKIKVDLKFNRNCLRMDLSNTYDPQFRNKQPGNGFGQFNVMKRLNLLYPGRFILKMEDLIEQNLYRCQLEITI